MHTESPISGNISLRRLKGLARSLALLVVFWLSACGPTRLLHLDGEPFVPRLPLVQLDGGWLAVDSCAKGIHALLELEVEAGEQTPVSGMPAAARLRYDAAGLRLAHRPRYARVDGPLCWNEGPRRFQEQGVWTGASRMKKRSFAKSRPLKPSVMLPKPPSIGNSKPKMLASSYAVSIRRFHID